jgi:hypothetical protein
MGEHGRKVDGRRVFSTDFKRATVQPVVTREKTVAELSRVYGGLAPPAGPKGAASVPCDGSLISPGAGSGIASTVNGQSRSRSSR